jgi:hypothetical protein
MKTFIATIALASTLALPAVAQTYYEPGSRPSQRLVQPGIGLAPDQAYARAIQIYPRQRSPNPAFDVYSVDGRYVGSDPDPRVRAVMQNDDAMLGND